MKRIAISLSLAVSSLLLLAGMAAAQSSGNFSATISEPACTLDSTTGQLSTTGCPANPTNGSTAQCLALSAPIKVSGGNGVSLLVTPSVVTGLFTDTKINSQFNSTYADVGVRVCVTVTDSSGTLVSGAVLPDECVVYDQRFQQISSGLFSQISSCVPVSTTQTCTTTADCTVVPAGSTVYCSNPSGADNAGTCEAFNSDCNIDLILSTLSAHSFNFVVTPPSQGTYNVNATWSLVGVSTSSSNASVAACTGPGTLTVMQGKVFNNSGSITNIQ